MEVENSLAHHGRKLRFWVNKLETLATKNIAE
jgi:hypothetical protein